VEREVYQEAKRIWQKAIAHAKRKSWVSFLEHSYGTNMWTAVRYTKTGRTAGVPMLVDGEGNCTQEDAVSKMQFLAKMAFPAPIIFQPGRGVPGPAGIA
jgi:hypothetical protein